MTPYKMTVILYVLKNKNGAFILTFKPDDEVL